MASLKICIYCKENKSMDEFYKMGRSGSARCKPCYKNQRKQRYRKDPIKERDSRKEYNDRMYEYFKLKGRERSKLKYKDPEYRKKKAEYNTKYVAKRLKTDIVFRFIYNSRCALSFLIREGKDRFISYYTGLTGEQLRKYIESQFKLGMCWENRKEWHIDHKIPISSAKTLEKAKELSHYTNLQVLWRHENFKKGNKLEAS